MNKLAIPHKVPTLQKLCMEVLCTYIEYVESFGVIPSDVQNAICALLAKKRLLNTNTLKLFLDPQCTSLYLTNISG
jgi:DNA repair protein RAD7